MSTTSDGEGRFEVLEDLHSIAQQGAIREFKNTDRPEPGTRGVVLEPTVSQYVLLSKSKIFITCIGVDILQVKLKGGYVRIFVLQLVAGIRRSLALMRSEYIITRCPFRATRARNAYWTSFFAILMCEL
jgi:hypothetical protein